MPRFRPLNARSLLLPLVVTVAMVCPVGAQDAPPPNPCEAPEVSQFDFWVGDWDLSWEGGHGTNRIERILDACVVQENFEGDMGRGGPLFKGRSVSTWDAVNGVWRQTWVDNQGGFLVFEGGMVGEQMILGMEREVQGKQVHLRMVFSNIQEDSLEWDWQRSTDEGANWQSVWAIHYQRRK